MAPPSFSDLGEAARDVFEKGYNIGFFKIDGKTKTENNVEFKTSLSSDRETGKVFGELSSEYKWAEHGLTFTEKWNTDNVLNAGIKVEDQLATGLELALDVTLSPQSGEKSSSFKSDYKTDFIHLNGDVDFESSGTTVGGSAVLGYEGWLAGYQLAFDMQESKLTASNFGFGYANQDFSFTTLVEDGEEFTGSLHHQVNEKFEAAVNLSWAARTGRTTFAIGGRYKLDDTASFSLKMNSQSHIAMCYNQQLRNGVNLIVSSLIDGMNIHQGGHKIGLGLEFEA
ncbi:unnamed protein product [Candidula unifasciata]|uniref:Voltage-dependent anion-selective channel protein 2 n=1 Tax=Candidula unifasciata TaxID=100452 RepID=A0A8S3ZWR1_9EUPU|nr:unnamed protein product [Candidula unifasciata]